MSPFDNLTTRDAILQEIFNETPQTLIEGTDMQSEITNTHEGMTITHGNGSIDGALTANPERNIADATKEMSDVSLQMRYNKNDQTQFSTKL
jgi:hypothetical protein